MRPDRFARGGRATFNELFITDPMHEHHLVSPDNGRAVPFSALDFPNQWRAAFWPLREDGIVHNAVVSGSEQVGPLTDMFSRGDRFRLSLKFLRSNVRSGVLRNLQGADGILVHPESRCDV